MATIPDSLIPKVPESFREKAPESYAPRGYRANLDELARQIKEGADSPPLLALAEALSNLKFHELMTMVTAIVGSDNKQFKVESPYDLASALNVWALQQLSKT